MIEPSVYVAAIVNAGRTHPSGTALIRRWIDGSWPLRGKDTGAQAAYLRPITVLVAVGYRQVGGCCGLTVIDARRVRGFSITAGRVDFDTIPAPDLVHLVGQPSPIAWKQGEGWPIKVIDLVMAPPTTSPCIAA